jgi:hypothetical protein
MKDWNESSVSLTAPPVDPSASPLDEDTCHAENTDRELRVLRHRARRPWGTSWWNTLQLASPWTWWGVARLRQVDLGSLRHAFWGVLVPAGGYYHLLTRYRTNEIPVRMGSASPTMDRIELWPCGGTSSPARLDRWFVLLLPLLACPWCLSWTLAAGQTVRELIAQMTALRNLQTPALLDAWQILADSVTNGRAYRTRSYDVYLPPPSSSTHPPPPRCRAALWFLPGAAVDHTAYAAPAAMLSDLGYLVVVVGAEPMRLATPELGCHAARLRAVRARVWERYRTASAGPCTTVPWYLVGHSLGAFTASHVVEELGVTKLVAWGVAPFPNWNDLSHTHQTLPQTSFLSMLLIQGSRDSIVETFGSDDKWRTLRARFPPSLEEHVLEGGTHCGFASYRSDAFPEVSDLPRSQQQARAVALTDAFLSDRCRHATPHTHTPNGYSVTDFLAQRRTVE